VHGQVLVVVDPVGLEGDTAGQKPMVVYSKNPHPENPDAAIWVHARNGGSSHTVYKSIAEAEAAAQAIPGAIIYRYKPNYAKLLGQEDVAKLTSSLREALASPPSSGGDGGSASGGKGGKQEEWTAGDSAAAAAAILMRLAGPDPENGVSGGVPGGKRASSEPSAGGQAAWTVIAAGGALIGGAVKAGVKGLSAAASRGVKQVERLVAKAAAAKSAATTVGATAGGGARAASATQGSLLRAQLTAEEVAGARLPKAITGYSRHGLDQAISKDGVGVSVSAIRDAFKNPLSITGQSGGIFRLTGRNAVVVVNSEGRIITTWPTNTSGYRVAP